MTTKIHYDISQDSIRLLQFSEFDGKRVVHMANGEYRDFSRHEILPREAFTEIREPVQLLDELLQAGYRPSDNRWTGGHVKALEKHIEFAELVAKKLLENVTPVPA